LPKKEIRLIYTPPLSAGVLEQRYGYTGREHDPETGLIYYRARHYDAATGQFIQRDPIGFAAGDALDCATGAKDYYKR